MRQAGFVYRQIRTYIIGEDQAFTGVVTMFPILVLAKFITIVALQLLSADAIEGGDRLQTMSLGIG